MNNLIGFATRHFYFIFYFYFIFGKPRGQRGRYLRECAHSPFFFFTSAAIRGPVGQKVNPLREVIRLFLIIICLAFFSCGVSLDVDLLSAVLPILLCSTFFGVFLQRHNGFPASPHVEMERAGLVEFSSSFSFSFSSSLSFPYSTTRST